MLYELSSFYPPYPEFPTKLALAGVLYFFITSIPSSDVTFTDFKSLSTGGDREIFSPGSNFGIISGFVDPP